MPIRPKSGLRPLSLNQRKGLKTGQSRKSRARNTVDVIP